MTKITVITGQTATGKTAYALKNAEEKNGELISADSRQIYKGLDIITGKDIEKKNFKLGGQIPMSVGGRRVLMNIGYYTVWGIKIWLYDVIDPEEPFSSYDFKQCALWVINDIKSRGKLPIIVGGTYLYLKHLLYGVDTENIPANWDLRKKLKNKPVPDLVSLLKKIDSKVFDRLNNSDKNNPHRLIRKIEIARSQKNTQSAKSSASGVKVDRFIGLRFEDSQKLSAAIEKRVGERLEKGAIEEVDKLLKQGLTKRAPGLRSLGYCQIIPYLEGKISKDEAIKKWIGAEVNYAKRQYTFMKTNKNIDWKLTR